MQMVRNVVGLLVVVLLASSAFAAIEVRVDITNNAPTGGVALTPVWVGFHDGSFDSYNGGLTSQPGLERIAEDGTVGGLGVPGTISDDFLSGRTYTDNSSGSPVSQTVLSSQAGDQRVDGALGSPSGPPPVQPGESVSQNFVIDADGSNRYFSYVSMVLPSNDFFVANGNPLAHDLLSLYDGDGSVTFNIGGFNASPVNDAGTEAESYVTSAANGLFGLAGGQGGPDTPAGSLGLPIANVNGLLPLDALNFVESSQPNFDFNNGNLYPNGIATVTITAVPEPSSTMFAWLSLFGLGMLRRLKLS